MFEDDAKNSGLCLEALHRHSAFVGDLCKKMLSSRPELIEWASLAASLHDIGKLVMAARTPNRHAKALRDSRERHCSFAQAEQQMHGITHAQLGAYLLGLWGFPYAVVDAVAGHHGPFDLSPKELDTASAVAIADMLAVEAGVNADPQANCPQEAGVLDLDYVRACGLEDLLPEWRNYAKEKADAEKRE